MCKVHTAPFGENTNAEVIIFIAGGSLLIVLIIQLSYFVFKERCVCRCCKQSSTENSPQKRTKRKRTGSMDFKTAMEIHKSEENMKVDSNASSTTALESENNFHYPSRILSSEESYLTEIINNRYHNSSYIAFPSGTSSGNITDSSIDSIVPIPCPLSIRETNNEKASNHHSNKQPVSLTSGSIYAVDTPLRIPSLSIITSERPEESLILSGEDFIYPLLDRTKNVTGI